MYTHLRVIQDLRVHSEAFHREGRWLTIRGRKLTRSLRVTPALRALPPNVHARRRVTAGAARRFAADDLRSDRYPARVDAAREAFLDAVAVKRTARRA